MISQYCSTVSHFTEFVLAAVKGRNLQWKYDITERGKLPDNKNFFISMEYYLGKVQKVKTSLLPPQTSYTFLAALAALCPPWSLTDGCGFRAFQTKPNHA